MKPLLAILLCLFVLPSCAALKRAGYTAAGAGGGAVAGAAVGGPVGAGVGAAAGAVAAQAVGESQELRDGDLVGEGAAVKYVTRYVPQPFIPTWLWIAVAGVLVWLKGHHLLRFLKTFNPSTLLGTMLPSWAQKKIVKTSTEEQ